MKQQLLKESGKYSFRRIMLVFGLVLTMLFSGISAAAAEDALTVKVSGSVEGGGLGVAEVIAENCSINLRYTKTEDGMILNAGLDNGDEAMFALLSAVSSDKISFQIPQYGENVYEMSLERAAELASEVMEQLQGSMTAGGNALDLQDLQPEFSEELIYEAFTPVLEAVSEHAADAVSVEEDAQAVLAGIQKTLEGCTVYTYQPTAEQTEKFVNTLADAAEGNEALDQFVSELAAYIRKLDGIIATSSAVAGSSSDDMSAAEFADALEQGYGQLPALLRENAAAAGEALEQSGFTVKVVLTEDGEFAMLEGTADMEGENVRFALEGLSQGQSTSFYGGLRVAEEQLAVSGEVMISGDIVSGTCILEVPEMGQIVKTDFEKDLSTRSRLGAFYGKIVTEAMGITIGYYVNGSPEGSDLHTVEVGGLENFDPNEEDPLRKITLCVESSGEATAAAPEGPVVDISEYTEEELGELFSSIAQSMASYFAG